MSSQSLSNSGSNLPHRGKRLALAIASDPAGVEPCTIDWSRRCLISSEAFTPNAIATSHFSVPQVVNLLAENGYSISEKLLDAILTHVQKGTPPPQDIFEESKFGSTALLVRFVQTLSHEFLAESHEAIITWHSTANSFDGAEIDPRDFQLRLRQNHKPLPCSLHLEWPRLTPSEDLGLPGVRWSIVESFLERMGFSKLSFPLTGFNDSVPRYPESKVCPLGHADLYVEERMEVVADPAASFSQGETTYVPWSDRTDEDPFEELQEQRICSQLDYEIDGSILRLHTPTPYALAVIFRFAGVPITSQVFREIVACLNEDRELEWKNLREISKVPFDIAIASERENFLDGEDGTSSLHYIKFVAINSPFGPMSVTFSLMQDRELNGYLVTFSWDKYHRDFEELPFAKIQAFAKPFTATEVTNDDDAP